MSDKENKLDDAKSTELNIEKVLEYTNKILPVIADVLEEIINKNKEDVLIDEFLLALCTVVPQNLLNNTEDDTDYSLLEINQLVNGLLFELKK